MLITCHFLAMLIVASIHKSYSSITRLPCKYAANFDVVLSNMQDTGAVGRTVTSETTRECTLECVSWPNCTSLNYNNGTNVCQLLERQLIESVASLKEKTGWVYMTTDDGKLDNGPTCQKLSPCQNGAKCEDTCTAPGYNCTCELFYYGTNCEKILQDCAAVKDSGKTQNGVYHIRPNVNFQLNVYCEFLSGAQSWILLQRRVDASVNFNLNWADYKSGFGVKSGNYWIGLDAMHKLARPGMGATLRFDLKHRNYPSTVYYADYTIFEVGDEASGYKLLIGGYSGTAGDSMAFHNGMKWTTRDKDNDMSGIENCAARWGGAWWHNKCHTVNLNNLYPTTATTSPSYMSWTAIAGSHGNIVYSEMKIKYKR